jgi:hypothetical protein
MRGDLAGSISAITARMMITTNLVAAVMISALVAHYEVEDQHCPNQHDRQACEVIRMCAVR